MLVNMLKQLLLFGNYSVLCANSGNMRPGNQSVKRNNGYEEDPAITAQIHLTLADLDADLAGGTS